MNLEIPQQTTTDIICIGMYIRTRNCHTQQFVSDQILLNLWSQKDYLQSWETQNLECFGSTRKLGPVSSQDFTRENFNLEKKKNERGFLFLTTGSQKKSSSASRVSVTLGVGFSNLVFCAEFSNNLPIL